MTISFSDKSLKPKYIKIFFKGEENKVNQQNFEKCCSKIYEEISAPKSKEKDSEDEIVYNYQNNDINKDTFLLFIRCINEGSIEFDFQQRFELLRLCLDFNYTELLEKIKKSFIETANDNEYELIIQNINSMLKDQNDNNNNNQKLIELENIIASNFEHAIRYKEQIGNLPLELLHRILNNSFFTFKLDENDNENQFIEFFISQLKKNGRNSNVLLTRYRFTDFSSDNLKRLLKQDLFDLCLMKDNNKCLKNLLNDLDQMKKDKSILEEKIEKLTYLFESKINELENRIKQLEISKEDIINENLKLKNQIQQTSSSISELKQSVTKKFIQIDPIKTKNGIFQYFFNEYKEHSIIDNFIEIKGCSYIPTQKNFPQLLNHIIDPKLRDYHWSSENYEHSYFTIYFKNHQAKIHSYKLMVGSCNSNDFFRSWILKGFTSDNQIIILDDVSDCNDIKNNHRETTRQIKCDKYFTSIQVEMKGKNNSKDFIMRIRRIEIFGDLQLLQ